MPTYMRPILVFIIGLAIDNAIAHGYLTPDKKQIFVDGALTIIGATGTVLLTAISLWHEYIAMHNKQLGLTKSEPSLLSNIIDKVKSFMIKPQVEKVVQDAVAAETPPQP